MHLPGTSEKRQSGQRTGHKELAATKKNGAESRAKDKCRWWEQQAQGQARMVVGIRRRGRRRKFGRRNGLQSKEEVSGAKISRTYKKSRWQTNGLRKTYKCQTEANDKVLSLNLELEKALVTLEILNERFELVNGDFVEFGQKSSTRSSTTWRRQWTSFAGST